MMWALCSNAMFNTRSPGMTRGSASACLWRRYAAFISCIMFMLKPSLPRPTVTPARTNSSTGARPTALFMFERGLCTLLVRVWARRPISPLRTCTQCAAILCGLEYELLLNDLLHAYHSATCYLSHLRYPRQHGYENRHPGQLHRRRNVQAWQHSA